MGDYKVCVYAICKNEEKFVDRFMDHIKELKDHVYILDTGSEDKTVEKFKERGAHIQVKTYSNFDFATARNDSLALVPEDYDICICLDIDDCIEEGFLEKIKEKWDNETTILSYLYIYDVDAEGSPTITFQCPKIHKRTDYKWIYPVHEYLTFIGEKEHSKDAPEIIVRHKPDWRKNRKFYLDILAEFVKNNPNDLRNKYMLAREYKSRKEWQKCIQIAHDYLKISNTNSKNDEELGQIYSFLSKAYCELEYYEEARLWAMKCLNNNKNCRTPYYDLMRVYYYQKKYKKALEYGLQSLKIEERNKRITEDRSCWDGTIYDYLSLSYYYLENYDKAIEYVDLAIEKQLDNTRLKDNRKLYVDRQKEKIKEIELENNKNKE